VSLYKYKVEDRMTTIEETYRSVKAETKDTVEATKALMSVHGLSLDDAADACWMIEAGKPLTTAAWYAGLEKSLYGE
jgi:hypothetical protein